MQSQETPRTRRVHGAEIKSKVLAECGQSGASVSAVALAHGLNANLVRNWLRGRGLQRAGLVADSTTAVPPSAPTPRRTGALQFVPIKLPEPGHAVHAALAAQSPARPTQPAASDVIEVELRGGIGQVTVRWPAPQAAQCTQWLRELAVAVLGAGAP